MSESRLPVTVISGILEAGKSTLLNRNPNIPRGHSAAITVNGKLTVNVAPDQTQANARLSRTDAPSGGTSHVFVHGLGW